MKTVEFEDIALEQFYEWEKNNKKTFSKILKLLDDCRQTPFEGIGKPEALKHNLKGFWSRRINKEHRLVYQVTETSIIIISCKFHY
jgi:toxin YoeB